MTFIKKLLFIGLLSPISISYAQTPLWGVGSLVGVADAEFQNPFVESGTPSSYSATNWTALSKHENYGATTPGESYWVRNTDGMGQGAYWDGLLDSIASPSQSNGVALFDSDFLDNAGITNNFGGGTAPSGQWGELISPRIDISGYEDTSLTVKFYMSYRNYNFSTIGVGISVDDGATWTTSNITPVSERVNAWEEQTFRTVTAGVSNLSQVRIKFIFEGDYYFFAVDDVSLITTAKTKLLIGEQDPTLNIAGQQVYIGSNRHLPLSQLSNKHFQKFGATVQNIGYKNVSPSDNIYLGMMVQQDVLGSWNSVYQDSVLIDTTIDQIMAVFSDTMRDFSWAEVGDYRVIYFGQGISNEDSAIHYFTVTNDDFISNVDIDSGGKPIANSKTVAAGTNKATEWGTMYYLENAGTTKLRFDSVDINYFVPTNFSGQEDQKYVVNIHEVDSSFATPNTYAAFTHVGVDTLYAQGLSGKLGSYNIGTLKNFVDPITKGAMQSLKDGHQYYISLLTSAELVSSNPTFGSTEVISMGVDNSKDYSLNRSTFDKPKHYDPVILVNSSNDTSIYATGFSGGPVPAIGVHISLLCPEVITTNIDTTITEGDNFEVNGIAYTVNGVYPDSLTTSAGCDSIVNYNLTVNPVSGISNIQGGVITVYPNPTSGKCHIKSANELGEWVVFNVMGVVIEQGQGAMVNLGQQPRGVYILALKNGSVIRIVKE